ncbi:MAG: G5 domain-containing protein [Armatimonadota bacterium]
MRRRKFRLGSACVAAVVFLGAVTAGWANRNEAAARKTSGQPALSATVTIESEGLRREFRTTQLTVGAVLKEAGVDVGPNDLVTPSLTERVRDGTKISVVRIRYELETVTEPIEYDTVKTFSRSIPAGRVREIRPGEVGQKVVRCRVRYENDKPVSRTIVGTEITKNPVNRVVCIGSRGRYTSRGAFRTRRVLIMQATAYDPGPRSCGRYATGRTACGLQAGYGVAAVDPCVIPLGTHLYIEGYGHAVAADRGRSIKSNRIDLGFPTYREAIRFGRKTVTVHVLTR